MNNSDYYRQTIRVDEDFLFSAEGILDFAITCDNRLVYVSYITNSKTKCDSLGCSIGNRRMKIQWNTYHTKNTGRWKYVCAKEMLGRRYFYRGISVNEGMLKESVILTDENHADEDFYNFCMTKFKLPILKEWTKYIKESLNWDEFRECGRVRTVLYNPDRTILVGDKELKLSEIKAYKCSFSEERLSAIISEGLKTHRISIGRTRNSKKLEFDGFDSYVANYGKALVDNLKEDVKPLMELKPSVDEVALYRKKLYPQQAAAVNGIINAIENKQKYAFLNEGMGVGKTIQAASIVDGYFNKKYMHKNNASLKDTLLSGEVKYRNVILCPGHLVQKWADEIESEIPGAKAIVVRSFSQFVTLRALGKERTGKEFYIMSKDFAKLGSVVEPIPTKVVRNHAANVKMCRACFEENNAVVIKKDYTECRCPDCGSKDWVNRQLSGRYSGLICPECGELLITSPKFTDEEKFADKVLTPKSFSERRSSNSYCYHCGTALWGVSAKTVSTPGSEYEKMAGRPSKWRKVRHFKNHAKKNKETAFVLKGWEQDYLNSVPLPDGWYEYVPCEKGPRKTAPSQYIKKYLKGYFDILILDECHKFQGGQGSAQAIAAHALSKASKFTLGLTGTLLNGKASSIFYLLWMLEPSRMVRQGFKYEEQMLFSRRYGAVETIFESDGDKSCNKSSRGRQVSQPREKPGISPMVYVHYLMDRAISLDLSDLSSYLPPFYENVELVEMEPELHSAYNHGIDIFRQALRTPEGCRMMGGLLNFGLSYPDKPWGRNPVMSVAIPDCAILTPQNLDSLVSGGRLLNKEAKLIEIIRKETAEGRNCFVYASYTGEKETNITGRLKEIIERHCNLKGYVQIIESSSPAAEKREEWMHAKAAEGIKVFICNPKVVETGLDFCFKHKGIAYNYPTLIFYQMSYELAVLWQASRRAYRLSQTAECRNYYLAYSGTLQAVAVQLMAEKQMATSAIQGKLSAEGLAGMANGVDPRVKLAQALSEGSTGDIEDISTMFDVLNKQNNAEIKKEEILSKTFFEVTGMADLEASDTAVKAETAVAPAADKVNTTKNTVRLADVPVGEQFTLFEMLGIQPVLVEKRAKKAPARNENKKESQKMPQFGFFEAVPVGA